MYMYLIRHAEADYSTGVPYHVAPGPALTEAGMQQAEQLGQLLAGSAIERVVCSPFRRCVLTAEALAASLGLDVVVDDDLREAAPGDPEANVLARSLRGVLNHVDARVVAFVGHAAPLTWMLRSLTNDEIVLPPKDQRGNFLAPAMVWAVYRRGGRWNTRHIKPGGVAS